jgi:pyruvate dehydrogenase E1 component alpha subunit
MPYTPEDLIAFEQEVAEAYNAAKIRAPVHLMGSDHPAQVVGLKEPVQLEQHLINFFGQIKPEDWVCGAWRMHYHCLLKGVPRERLMADIIDGRSITLTYPEQRIVTSAIVGGILPIALGIAASINLRKGSERVWCFLGDMTASSGIYHECAKYGFNHQLPIVWVLENNGRSVDTPTDRVWGGPSILAIGDYASYQYNLKWPHAGAGKRIEF